VLGFFRIWEIPQDQVRGLIGRFHPVLPLWRWELENRGVWDLDRLTGTLLAVARSPPAEADRL
jgi:4-alpha-glucanotransferase